MVKQYKKYNESGIEWIGEIPNKWNIVKLKFLADTKFSSVDRHELEEEIRVAICHYPQAYKNEKINTETALSTGTCNQNELDNFSLKKGQVIITKDSETADDIGIPTYVEEDIPNAVCGYHLAILQSTHKNFNTKFLFRYLQSNHVNYYFENNSNGVTRFGLGKPTIENLAVPLPSIEEQSQIVFYLNDQTGIIDQIISKKQKLIELLKEKRQATISEAVTKGLNPNAKMKESGVEWLGEIPVDWKLTPFRFIAVKIGSGVTPKGGAEVYKEEGVTFIRSQNVHFDGLRLDDVAKIDLETHEKMSNSKVQFKDVLLNITGASIGRCCVVNIDEEMNVNQHVCIIRPKSSKVVSEYLNLVLQSDIGQTQVRMELTGGNRDGLTFEALKAFVLPLPALKLQDEIVNQVSIQINQLFELETKIISQIEKLKEFRQSIISEAVTGKIDVREWQPNTQNNLAYT